MSPRDLAAPGQALAAALALVDQGLPCFPCAPTKCPATPSGFKDAISTREGLTELWRLYPGSLVGVPTGEASGLSVLDVDPRNGGGKWFAANRSSLPVTRVHRTRSGGVHLLFRHRAGLRCSAGKIAPGIDVRATGGYVIWWPAAGLPELCAADEVVFP